MRLLPNPYSYGPTHKGQIRELHQKSSNFQHDKLCRERDKQDSDPPVLLESSVIHVVLICLADKDTRHTLGLHIEPL